MFKIFKPIINAEIIFDSLETSYNRSIIFSNDILNKIEK